MPNGQDETAVDAEAQASGQDQGSQGWISNLVQRIRGDEPAAVPEIPRSALAKFPPERTCFAILQTDPHFGYRFGLLKPETHLESFDEADGDFVPELTVTQEQLWQWNSEDFAAISELTAGAPTALLLEGDVCHGTWVGDVVSPRMADQPVMAVAGLKRWVELPQIQLVRFVKGTRVHSHGHGSLELLTAHILQLETGKPVGVSYHMNLSLAGVSFDLAHKGPAPGKRQWLDANELRLYVRSIMERDLVNGKRPPHVVVRGHYHERRFAHVHEHREKDVVDTWGIIVPAYSIFKDDYTNHSTQAKSHMNAGTVVVEFQGGKVRDVHDFTHTFDLRKREEF
jgi:hypothetical protein